MPPPGDSTAARTEDAASAASLDDLRTRVAGTNINEKTLLATDYLNHFNEFVMVLDLIPDMPDCLDDAKDWQPKEYKDHFRDSAFSSKDLAIEAYDSSPPEYRTEFETTVAMINSLIPRVLERITDAIESGDTERVTHECANTSGLLKGLMDVVSAVINGEKKTVDQHGIDALLTN